MWCAERAAPAVAAAKAEHPRMASGDSKPTLAAPYALAGALAVALIVVVLTNDGGDERARNVGDHA